MLHYLHVDSNLNEFIDKTSAKDLAAVAVKIINKSEIQAYLRDIACLVPDYWNKANIAIKRVT